MNSIFNYRDFRDFLKDRITLIKKKTRGFTYRYIASELGLKSAGHITQIVNGTAAITEKLFPKIIETFEIKGKEKQYFKLLIDYYQTPVMNEKREILKKISSFNSPKAITISRDQYEFYQKWYYAAIRDILDIVSFNGDYKKLARMVEPSISIQEARNSIKILERLDLIVRNDDGVYKSSSKILSSNFENETSVVLSGYAEEMATQALYALNNMDKSERSISWAGFSASKDGYNLINEEIRLFRERIMDIVDKDSGTSRVYHMNIHCFPISKNIGEVNDD